ncbi:MAG: phospho-N-acetylmuramoyl-pentapeptide-transferase [Candidatus Aureabacteria bacterium]|nr:phospho-N-acetylmuramoyl-pentapeptide-transferase [Candidatus Auribacterota bacterium]
MLYYIFYPLREYFFGFNVFRYITFRAAGAAVTALILSVWLGPWVIRKMRELEIGSPVRRDWFPLYDQHKGKEGTPTMGGVLIILTVLFSSILWANILNPFVLLVLLSLVWLGAIGFIDDYMKVTKKSSRGMTARVKFAGQVLLALSIGSYLLTNAATAPYAGEVSIPFYKHPLITNLGVFYIVFLFFVIVGSSNAVNLTDGLDGLAIGCVIIAAFAYAVMSYVGGHVTFARYLQIRYIPNSGELAVCCASIVGAGLGFLWYNAYPAEIFMGDTGSLALGGAIGLVAVLIKKELALLLVGGVFVMEAASVILQVASFKLTGKRIFLISPLHHHFQMKGWSETKVTVRFWILAIIFALIALGSLKLQ